jgi:hypothetical protein
VQTKHTHASSQPRVWRTKPREERLDCFTALANAQHNISNNANSSFDPDVLTINKRGKQSTEQQEASDTNAKCFQAQSHVFMIMPSATLGGQTVQPQTTTNMPPSNTTVTVSAKQPQQQPRTCPTCGSMHHNNCVGRYRARAATLTDLEDDNEAISQAEPHATASTTKRNLSAQVPVAWLTEHWLARAPCQECGSRHHFDCKGRSEPKNKVSKGKRAKPQSTRVWMTKALRDETTTHPSFQALAEQVEMMLTGTQITAMSISDCPVEPISEPLDHRLRHNVVWGILRRAADKLGLKRLSGYTLQKGCSELSIPHGCHTHVFRWTWERNEIDYRKTTGPEPIAWPCPIPLTHIIAVHEDIHAKPTVGSAFIC